MSFLFLLLLNFAWADDSLVRLESTFQSAGNYSGSIYAASSDVSLGTRTKLLPRAQYLTRTFQGGPSFAETTLTLGAAQKLTASTYLLGDFSTTPNAQIASKWNSSVEPHWAIGASDLGCRFSFAQYADTNAGLVTPSYLYAITDSLYVSEAVTGVRADRWYVSSATQIIGKPLKDFAVRVIPAFGETLESAGAPASFTSMSVEVAYAVSSKLRFGIGGTNYRSTLRTEQSVLFRIEAL